MRRWELFWFRGSVEGALALFFLDEVTVFGPPFFAIYDEGFDVGFGVAEEVAVHAVEVVGGEAAAVRATHDLLHDFQYFDAPFLCREAEVVVDDEVVGARGIDTNKAAAGNMGCEGFEILRHEAGGGFAVQAGEGLGACE